MNETTGPDLFTLALWTTLRAVFLIFSCVGVCAAIAWMVETTLRRIGRITPDPFADPEAPEDGYSTW